MGLIQGLPWLTLYNSPIYGFLFTLPSYTKTPFNSGGYRLLYSSKGGKGKEGEGVGWRNER